MKQYEKLQQQELKEVLKGLQSYASMTKQLGARGKKLFSQKASGTKSYAVDFFPNLGEDAAWEKSQEVFAKSFDVSPSREEIIFSPLDTLKGGMKVYVDDMMVDMSYDAVERKIQK